MKKLLIGVLSLVLITGCGSKKEETTKQEEEKVPSKYEKVDNDIKEEITKIENLDIPGMRDISVNLLRTEFGLNLDLVENYVSGISTTDEYKLYLAIKPKTGKEEVVKRAITNYIENLEMKLKDEARNQVVTDENGNIIEKQFNPDEEITSDKLTILKNRLETEINGYIVYIISSSNEEILNVLKTKLS